jgi:formylmethanofuran dehydrogenase subunit C
MAVADAKYFTKILAAAVLASSPKQQIMPIELISNLHDMIPVDVREINTGLLYDKSLRQIAKTTVHHGNRSVEFGELFRLRGNHGDGQVIWKGNLKHVHQIGYRMDQGEWIVEGTAGNHVGREMSGGQITVRGDVGDHAGGSMRGGLIRIQGNAGDQAGGCHPGSKFGMNRGTILITGNAGTAAGNGMRRGLIAIGGDAQGGLGINMQAGTIVVLGKCKSPVASNMKRGTIVIGSNDRENSACFSSINFRRASRDGSPVVGLIAHWLEKSGFEFDRESFLRRQFEQFAGDQVHHGRGEVFVAT